MKKIVGLLCFLMLANVAFSQLENAEVEWKEGKKYYVHFVQAGNTLYGLTKLYNVNAETILAENPEVANGLKVGQKIMVPAGKQDAGNKNQPVLSEGAQEEGISFQRTHTVAKTETLFGISKKYNLTVDELVKANPGVDKGINVGQVLNIPEVSSAVKGNSTVKTQQKVIFYDTVIEHKVLGHETVYSISKRFMIPANELTEYNGIKNQKIKSGDVLKIPLKKEKITKVEIRGVEPSEEKAVDKEIIYTPKNTYNIVYLLPFGFDKKDPLSGISTEFVMGAQTALDSLQGLGLKANVSFLDAPSDTVKLKTVLSKPEIKNADMIIGPFMGNNLEYVANWCKNNKIRFISPMMGQTNILKSNPYAYNLVTSDITLMKGLAVHIHQQHKTDNIILVKPTERDEELYQAFRQKFMQLSLKDTKQKIIEVNTGDLATYIQKGGSYVIVMPARDRATSLKFINSLHTASNKAGSGNITLYATKEWTAFDDIKGYYKNRYNFHFPIANDFNYSYPETMNLLYKIRKKYNTDLSKYGTQGFDATFYAIYHILLGNEVKDGVMN